MMYYSEISLYLEVKTGNKMSGKKEERKGILLNSFRGETKGWGVRNVGKRNKNQTTKYKTDTSTQE